MRSTGVPLMFNPAELTSRRTGPNSASAAANSASTALSSPTSAWHATARPPPRSISFATAAPADSSENHVNATDVPERPRASAQARPMPDSPPVTTAQHGSTSGERALARFGCRSGQLDLAHRVAARTQRLDQLVQLLAIARFALDVGDEPLRRQVGEDALMIDLEDVDVVRVERVHHLQRRPGPVLQRDAQPRQAPRTGQVPQQHIG